MTATKWIPVAARLGANARPLQARVNGAQTPFAVRDGLMTLETTVNGNVSVEIDFE